MSSTGNTATSGAASPLSQPAGAKQPVISVTLPPGSGLDKGYPENPMEDRKPDGYYREHHKTFSKCLLDQKFDQFVMGKYSKKYMEVYLDFAHLEGVITNIEYLQYKGKLGE